MVVNTALKISLPLVQWTSDASLKSLGMYSWCCMMLNSSVNVKILSHYESLPSLTFIIFGLRVCFPPSYITPIFQLIRDYEKDDEVRGIVNRYDIISFVPVVNPDGYEYTFNKVSKCLFVWPLLVQISACLKVPNGFQCRPTPTLS